jgi:hypothetical protein
VIRPARHIVGGRKQVGHFQTGPLTQGDEVDGLAPRCPFLSTIQYTIWLYLRFTLSYRDVEELVAERGIDLSHETIRRWVLKLPR